MKHCPCKKLLDKIEEGVHSLSEEKAPTNVIDDYFYDMTSGEWVECEGCPDNDFE